MKHSRLAMSTFLAPTLALTLTLAVGGLTANAYAGSMATGAEIKAAISDKTLHGSMTSEGYETYAEYYAPDGAIKAKGYSGKWRVTDDAACMKYGEYPEGCWQAKIDGPATIWYQDGKVVGTGTLFNGNRNKF